MSLVYIEVPENTRLVSFDMEAAYEYYDKLVGGAEKTREAWISEQYTALQCAVKDLGPSDKIVGCFVAYDSAFPAHKSAFPAHKSALPVIEDPRDLLKLSQSDLVQMAVRSGIPEASLPQNRHELMRVLMINLGWDLSVVPPRPPKK